MGMKRFIKAMLPKGFCTHLVDVLFAVQKQSFLGSISELLTVS